MRRFRFSGQEYLLCRMTLGMMRQSVEQCRGETFISKDLDPIGELQIGGQDHGQAFVKLGAEGEQHLRPIG